MYSSRVFLSTNKGLLEPIVAVNLYFRLKGSLMIGMNIAMIVLGVVFIGFGYAIRFKGKYNLINDFEAEEAVGTLDVRYAKEVGSIEFYGGIVFVVSGIATIFLDLMVTIYALIIGTVSMCLVLIGHRLVSVRRKKKS